MRYGGQNSVTVPWLLPANSATAAANAEQRQEPQRARASCYRPGRRGARARQGVVDARQLAADLRLHLLQQRGRGLGAARCGIEIAVEDGDRGGQRRARRSIWRDSRARRALSSLSLRFSRRKNVCSGDSSTASGWSMRPTRTSARASLRTARSARCHHSASAGAARPAQGSPSAARRHTALASGRSSTMRTTSSSLRSIAGRRLTLAGGALGVALHRALQRRQPRLRGTRDALVAPCAVPPAAARRCRSPAPAAAPGARPIDVDQQVLVARARQALHQVLELRALQRHLGHPRSSAMRGPRSRAPSPAPAAPACAPRSHWRRGRRSGAPAAPGWRRLLPQHERRTSGQRSRAAPGAPSSTAREQRAARGAAPRARRRHGQRAAPQLVRWLRAATEAALMRRIL